MPKVLPILMMVASLLAGAARLDAWTSVDGMADGTLFASRVAAKADGTFVMLRGGSVRQLDGVTGTELWARSWLGGVVGAVDMAVTAAGDVIATGRRTTAMEAGVRVAKYAGADGSDLWTYDEASAASAWGLAVALTADGDAVAAVKQDDATLAVVRLDGATGSVVWREELDDLVQAAVVVVGADGHPVVAAIPHPTVVGPSPVVKLDGATGDVLWEIAAPSQCATALALDVAIHPDGDVLLAGSACANVASTRSLAVTKLAGASGATVWQRGVDSPPGAANDEPFARALTVLGSGDVVAGGAVDVDPHVLALSPAGTPLWSWTAHDAKTPATVRGVADVAIDGAGAVFATARLGSAGVVVKLDGGDGTETWRRGFRLEIDGGAHAIAADASDDVAFFLTGSYPVSQTLSAGVGGLKKLRGTDGESFVGTRCGSAICGRCERCDAPDVCIVGPRSDCRVSAAANASLLQLRDGATPAQDRLLWKWSGPPASLPADLGDPRLHDDQTLCVYEDVAATAALVFSDTLGAIEDCGSKSCWRLSGPPDKPTFGYSASKFSVKLTAGPGKKSRILWKTSGAALGMPPLGLATPVRAELRGSNGICWAAGYDAGITKNTPADFKAKGGGS